MKLKGYRKGLEKNNSFNFKRILEEIISKDGQIGEIYAILLLKPSITDKAHILDKVYFKKLDVAKDYLNDLLNIEGIEKTQLKMEGYEKFSLDYYIFDLEKYEHLKGLSVKDCGEEIKDILIENYKAKKISH